MQPTSPHWFDLNNPDQFDSPALLIDPKRIAHNIDQLIQIAQKPDRLRPHIKTHKMAEVVAMHLERGISQFKCATIAEAEMLGISQASHVLLAYQPVGPKIKRLLQLSKTYPETQFGALVDDPKIAEQLSAACVSAQASLDLWLDLNNGMGRTGITPSKEAAELYALIHSLPNIEARGLHVYDGQFRQSEFANRKLASDQAFKSVYELRDALQASGLPVSSIIAGGSPTFPVHALREQIELSPGTYVLWDAGYAEKCPELPFLSAAVVMTRIISKPGGHRLCLDLGHKAISAENPIENRVRFLNAEVSQFLGQSEEHLVVEVKDASQHQVGDVWYGIPWHVCPTVALYQEANVIQDRQAIDTWSIIARDRRITV